MSWKGFKKAMNRLPHMIQVKSGYSTSEHVDDQFDELHSQFQELCQLSSRLNDAATKYRDAVKSMLQHQQAFSNVLLEVYEPITGGLSSNVVQPQNDSSLQRAQMFGHASSELSASLQPQIDLMIDRKIVMPSKDLLEIHKMVNKTIVKRDHKKIDYDRHSDSLRKVKASSEDERKVIKAQNTVDVAFAEYEKYNMLLKSELPVYIQLRIDFIDPILLSMLEFQNTLFSEMCRNLEPLKSATDMRFSAMDGFEIQKESINAMFNEITLLSAPITGKQHRKGGETGEFDDDFDGEDTNPFNSYHETGETIAVTNPFFPNPRENSNNPPAPNKRQLAVCLYDFEPQQEGDLKIRKGDQIEVLERTADTNGWWRGRSLNGEEGLFPGNYVKQLD